MKTQLRIRSLRGLATCAVVAALLNGVYAQPDAENYSLLSNSEDNMKAYIQNAEVILKYKAPANTEMEISDPETQNSLDLFVAENTEAVLKYKASDYSENEESYNIDPFIEAAINDLKYRAPEEDNSRIDMISEYTIVKPAHKNHHPVKVEYYKGKNIKPTFVKYDEKPLRTIFPSKARKSSKHAPKNYANKY